MDSCCAPTLMWSRTSAGALRLRVDDRIVAVSRGVSRVLSSQLRERGLSSNPVADLVTVDRRLRATLCGIALLIQRCADESTMPPALRSRWSRLHARNRLIDQRARLSRDLLTLWTFVALLSIADQGPRSDRSELREPPPGVREYPSLSEFLRANPRRARTSIPGRTLTLGPAIYYGDFWRRDGDDAPGMTDVKQSGVWSLAYLPKTQELVGFRVCDHLPEQVWLIMPQAHRDLVKQFQEWQCMMSLPNSLLRLAAVAQLIRQSTSTFSPFDAPRPEAEQVAAISLLLTYLR